MWLVIDLVNPTVGLSNAGSAGWMMNGWLDSLICGLPCVVRQGIRLDRLVQPETCCVS